MSRELKFRVWSEDQKTYDYKFPYNSIGDFYVNTRGKVFSDFGNAVAPELRRDAFVVEQYTGLKDKNGKEIYEGDIITETIDDGSNKIIQMYEVYWDIDTLCWSIKGVKGFDYNLHDDLWQTNSSREVIGNIHDNPELIKDDTMGN